ncbi:MAG: hypothetical protein Q9224_003685 [Gallowayella concinna]
MYIHQTIIFALAAATGTLGSALPPTNPYGASTLNTRQNGVTCQTSGGSPKTKAVTDAINELGGSGRVKCPQLNGVASKCTTLVKQDSAAISICGEENDEDGGPDCAQVIGWAIQIQNACLSDDRVGGTYTTGPAQRIEVINSKDTNDK